MNLNGLTDRTWTEPSCQTGRTEPELYAVGLIQISSVNWQFLRKNILVY